MKIVSEQSTLELANYLTRNIFKSGVTGGGDDAQSLLGAPLLQNILAQIICKMN